ncbi:MAG: hypothetical protein ACTSVO_11195 [Candidatus Heimdallarchaeaceae archaeon]
MKQQETILKVKIRMAKECPKCHSKNLKEVEDKTKVIAYFNHQPIYRKKAVCRECTYEWFPEGGAE